MEHQFTAAEKDAGERIDKWLCERLHGFSRKQVKSLLDGGRVLINGRRVLIAGWELEVGDNVEVRVPPGFEREAAEATKEEEGGSAKQTAHRPDEAAHPVVGASIDRYLSRQKAKRAEPQVPREEGGKGKNEKHGRPEGRDKQGKQDGREKHGRPEGRDKHGKQEGREKHGRQGGRERHERRGKHERPDRLRIYYEDRDVIVVDKPAGIVAVPAEGADEGDTLLARVHAYLKRRLPNAKHSFVGPLHRLDSDTSGIMVFALSKEGMKLEHQFRDHSIRREYTAVVAGRVEQQEGVIDKPLEKGDFGGGKKVREAEDDAGRKAVTEFRVKERYANATLLTVRVRTGRTHQIRVHLAGMGFPLLGDKLYAGTPEGEAPSFPRHALHANTLGFRHPASGRKFMFHSSLPRDLKELIDSLRGS